MNPESFKIMFVKDNQGNVKDLNLISGNVSEDGDVFRAMVMKDNNGRVSYINVIDNDVDDVDGPDTVGISVIRDNFNNIVGFEIIDNDDDDDIMEQGEKFVKSFLKG